MSTNTSVRVRFAPAPTGMMHLGNVRTALMNYLVARQKQGTFILRIEDTDAERNFDPGAVKLQEDLAWLSISFDEGPGKGGPHAPYYQSERASIYQENLQKLIATQHVYRCFCTAEELEKKRQRQIALKQPPRYDRTCHKISDAESLEKAKTLPFIWRMYVDHARSFTICDLAHGNIVFEMKNFSDFPLTRQDGSVTFIFANFIDDALMKVSCAIRGEDHLSNTASQAVLYDAFGFEIPKFWHMPILCNIDGKKLSKRDFGFSLRDLKESGFLPQAILNYLAIIGASFKEEIMSVEELIKIMNFDSISTTGQIKYDVEKLRWVNSKWINRLSIETLERECRPFLERNYPEVKNFSSDTLATLLKPIVAEMVTLCDVVELLNFCFTTPECHLTTLQGLITDNHLPFFKSAFTKILNSADMATALDSYKKDGKAAGISPKQLFSVLRYILTGRIDGISIIDLTTLLDKATINMRIEKTLSQL
jgi:nondiscriminating glutamyl-tRNA synthetase